VSCSWWQHLRPQCVHPIGHNFCCVSNCVTSLSLIQREGFDSSALIAPIASIYLDVQKPAIVLLALHAMNRWAAEEDNNAESLSLMC
jgi:hypothetical protein